MVTKKVLYISGSLGLGHIVRDLAIARELRRQIPEVKISWLAAHPANLLLKEAGEEILPEADLYADENIPAENAASGFTLNLMQYLSKANKEWKENVNVFKQVTDRQQFDVIIGDETYEITIALKKKDVIIESPFVMIYDFLGCDAMTWNPIEKLYAYMWNWIWSGNKIFAEDKNLALFVGELENIPDKSFGFLLPNRRDYARTYYEFIGYIFPFDAAEYSDKAKIREKLGYGDGPLVVCSIGGTSIGKDLLELCGKAYPIIKESVPDLRMVLVCGPRLSPESLEVPEEVEVRGYIPSLYEHFAASELAIVQGGGTSTLELTALGRPFLYFPLEGHSEQQIHVEGRLNRHQAGIKMVYSRTTPNSLAKQVISNLGKEVNYASIPSNGAEKAVQLIKKLLITG
jgi:UDP:flavonoid glycosyltransferase YjiC (YdhE family)